MKDNDNSQEYATVYDIDYNDYYADLGDMQYNLQGPALQSIGEYGEQIIDTLNAMEDFIDNSYNVLEGEVWDIKRSNYQKDCELLNFTKEQGELLEDTISNALETLREYLGDDTSLSTSQLPELNESIDNIQAEINNIKKMMEEKTKICQCGSDECEGCVEIPKYDNGALQAQIDTLQIILDDAKALVAKIEGLKDVIIQINSTLNTTSDSIFDLVDEINREYNDRNFFKRGTATLGVGAISLLSGALEVGEDLFDALTWGLGKGITLASGGLAKGLFLDESEKVQLMANSVANWSNNVSSDFARFIGRDLVGDGQEWFYNTQIGQNLDENSIFSHDSQRMENVEKFSENGIKLVIKGLFGKHPYGIVASGLIDAGNKAEEIYSQAGNAAKLSMDDKKIVGAGMEGALKAYSLGGVASKIGSSYSSFLGNSIGNSTRLPSNPSAIATTMAKNATTSIVKDMPQSIGLSMVELLNNNVEGAKNKTIDRMFSKGLTQIIADSVDNAIPGAGPLIKDGWKASKELYKLFTGESVPKFTDFFPKQPEETNTVNEFPEQPKKINVVDIQNGLIELSPSVETMKKLSEIQ